MYYYPFHINDFRSGAANLTRLARWIYRDMLDLYYDKESQLPPDLDQLCDAIGVETDEERKHVERVLRLKFVKTDEGYFNPRCQREIETYRIGAEIARQNGRRGGRPRRVADETQENPAGSQPVPDGMPVG